MEKKDKKELVKIVAGCVAAVISISCIVAYKIHSDKENAKYEAQGRKIISHGRERLQNDAWVWQG